jgi:hypothetical protein
MASENPMDENKDTRNAQRKSSDQPNDPEPTVPPRSTPKPEFQPVAAHHQVAGDPGKNWWDKIKPIVECAGVLLLTVYTGFTVAMYFANKEAADAARDAAKTSKESLESVQRAFLVFQTIRADHELRGKIGQWRIGGIWQNAGDTPAIHVSNYFNTRILSAEPDEQTFRGPEAINFPSTYIGPKANQLTNLIFKSDDYLTLTRAPSEKEGRYMWGWIAYNDSFPDTPIHVTETCELLAGETIVNNQISPAFALCHHHNCTDDNCEDYKDIVASARK